MRSDAEAGELSLRQGAMQAACASVRFCLQFAGHIFGAQATDGHSKIGEGSTIPCSRGSRAGPTNRIGRVLATAIQRRR